MSGILRRPLEGESATSPETPLLDHLSAICASKTFENSAGLRSLLLYLFQNRNQQISEYKIAVEALSRRADFDPHIDATVRVQISRLRRRLKEYYLHEGRDTAIRFSIPLGTHQLIPEPASAGASAPEGLPATSLPEADSESHSQRVRVSGAHLALIVVLSFLVLVLALLCGWQYWQLRFQPGAISQGSPDQLLPVWKDFCTNGKPARIVIPNPTFFSWATPNGSNLMVRDIHVNDFADMKKSPGLAELQRHFGKPELVEFYAVSSDVLASLKLMHYMESRAATVTTTISSDTSAELFEGENVILVGTPGTLTPFRHQLDRLYFKFDPEANLLLNPRPLPSEPKEFKRIEESPSRNIYPGLVALLPGVSPSSHLMILAGSQTAALVVFLTSTSGSQALEEARSRAGHAPFFEAVILSEKEGNTVLNSHLAAFRAFSPGAAQPTPYNPHKR
jgi:hypothetical protein